MTDESPSDDDVLDRRTYLTLAAAVAGGAASAGCAGLTGDADDGRSGGRTALHFG